MEQDLGPGQVLAQRQPVHPQARQADGPRVLNPTGPGAVILGAIEEAVVEGHALPSAGDRHSVRRKSVRKSISSGLSE
jgi:hypothetical protein